MIRGARKLAINLCSAGPCITYIIDDRLQDLAALAVLPNGLGSGALMPRTTVILDRRKCEPFADP